LFDTQVYCAIIRAVLQVERRLTRCLFFGQRSDLLRGRWRLQGFPTVLTPGCLTAANGRANSQQGLVAFVTLVLLPVAERIETVLVH